jgi:hypothetical protein
LPGDTSHLQVTSNSPAFYFYFNVSDSKVSDFGTETSTAAQSPDEFSLVRFQIKNGSREIPISKASFYGGVAVSLKKGIDPKYTLKFNNDEIGAGIYRVSPAYTLEAGEYAFVFTGASGASRIYDFSVIAAAAAASDKK